MKILFIGDIIGRSGRGAVKKLLGRLKKENNIDLVVANGENLAHGSGMTVKTYSEMREAGVDFFTTGNHILDKTDIFPEMSSPRARIIRPANFPPGNPGKGHQIIAKNGKRLLIINLNGRVFFDQNYDCPFRTADRILADHKKIKLDGIFVDFHAEATSEKIAMQHYLNGRVSALVCTHTHVATADARITEGGMAYITDVGMVGPIDSVIGAEKESVIESFLKQTKFKFEVPAGLCIFNAVIIELSGRASSLSINFIQEYAD